MRLEVVTPKGPLVAVDVDEVTAPGVLGEFGVLPGHVPFLTGLRAGVVVWRHGQAAGAVAVGPGYAEVAHERIVVLTDLGQLAAEVDTAGAQGELAAVQQQLDHEQDDEGARAELAAKKDWAQARLDAAAALRASSHTAASH